MINSLWNLWTFFLVLLNNQINSHALVIIVEWHLNLAWHLCHDVTLVTWHSWLLLKLKLGFHFATGWPLLGCSTILKRIKNLSMTVLCCQEPITWCCFISLESYICQKQTIFKKIWVRVTWAPVIVTSRCYWERVDAFQDGGVASRDDENGKSNFSAILRVVVPHFHSRNREFTESKKALS